MRGAIVKAPGGREGGERAKREGGRVREERERWRESEGEKGGGMDELL